MTWLLCGAGTFPDLSLDIAPAASGTVWGAGSVIHTIQGAFCSGRSCPRTDTFKEPRRFPKAVRSQVRPLRHFATLFLGRLGDWVMFVSEFSGIYTYLESPLSHRLSVSVTLTESTFRLTSKLSQFP